MDAMTLLLTILKILLVLLALPVVVGISTYAERKVLGRLQIRYGPNRAGPFGVLQWVADAVKLITKEYVVPAAADRWLFIAAPLFTFVPAVMVYALIPFGKGLVITDVNVGLLMLLAISSLSVYGIIFGGWASNSKYSLLGALRSASQMIAYELSLGLALVGVVLMAGSLSLVEIVQAQRSRAVRAAAAPRLPDLPGRRHRRDQPHPLRPARGRGRTRRRLPHGVLRDGLRALSARRVRLRLDHLGPGDDALSRRLAGARDAELLLALAACGFSPRARCSS